VENYLKVTKKGGRGKKGVKKERKAKKETHPVDAIAQNDRLLDFNSCFF